MSAVENIRASLNAPVVIDEKLAQLQQTFAEDREGYPDQMEVNDDFGGGRALPSDIAQRALSLLVTKASSGAELNELEQLGYYLLQVKAGAEYRAPVIVPIDERVTSRHAGIVRAKFYCESSAEAFVRAMQVEFFRYENDFFLDDEPYGSHHGPRHLRTPVANMVNVEVLKAERKGPTGTLQEIDLELKLTLECRALLGTVISSLLNKYRVRISNRREPIGVVNHSLQDIGPL